MLLLLSGVVVLRGPALSFGSWEERSRGHEAVLAAAALSVGKVPALGTQCTGLAGAGSFPTPGDGEGRCLLSLLLPAAWHPVTAGSNPLGIRGSITAALPSLPPLLTGHAGGAGGGAAGLLLRHPSLRLHGADGQQVLAQLGLCRGSPQGALCSPSRIHGIQDPGDAGLGRAGSNPVPHLPQLRAAPAPRALPVHGPRLCQ